MEIKIVDTGVSFEVRMILNGIKFFTHKEFETKEEARDFLKKHGLKENQ